MVLCGSDKTSFARLWSSHYRRWQFIPPLLASPSPFAVWTRREVKPGSSTLAYHGRPCGFRSRLPPSRHMGRSGDEHVPSLCEQP